MNTRPAAARLPASRRAIVCAFTVTPSLAEKPKCTVDVAYQHPGQPAAERGEGGAVRLDAAGDQYRLLAGTDVLERNGHRALLQLGVDGYAVLVEVPAPDLPDRPGGDLFVEHPGSR